ncbi:hypothetical protein ACH4TV_11245 [Streptomyces sp. NPDC020898]|uniref:hypothetical protein n=1 Tax=Streptomyces sp. NPDC020898 TaxID=3365101 RepID=UPI00378E2DBB
MTLRAAPPVTRQGARRVRGSGSHRQIAKKLHVTVRTVEQSLTRVHRKPHLCSRTDLTLRRALDDMEYAGSLAVQGNAASQAVLRHPPRACR